jgi:hypothetical protein
VDTESRKQTTDSNSAAHCCGVICGGAVVATAGDTVWVVTAAHCVHDKRTRYGVRVWAPEPADLAVTHVGIAADHPAWKAVPPERVAVLVHPGYSPVTMRNDIALLRCTVPGHIAAALRPLRLPAAGEPIPPQGMIVGFALTGATHDQQPFLRTARVAVERPDYRQRTSSHLVFDPRWHVWAAGHAPDGAHSIPDTCEGDSGGPLLDATGTVLVGITSWGVSCGDPLHPGVYALVQPFLDPPGAPGTKPHPHTRRMRSGSPWRAGLRTMIREGGVAASEAKTSARAGTNPRIRDPAKLRVVDSLEVFAGSTTLSMLAALATLALVLGVYLRRRDEKRGRRLLVLGAAIAALALLSLLVTYC